jgi:hypothetical protein
MEVTVGMICSSSVNPKFGPGAKLVSAQSLDKIAGDLAGTRNLAWVEGNRGNARVAAATEFFGQRSEVFVGRGLVPRVGAQ